MGLDDFAPATQANNLDEDLFDFPPMELPAAPQAEAEAAPAEMSAADVADAPAAAPAAKKATVCTGLDPKLDEDLFGFPPMDLSSLGIVQGDDAEAGIEESIDKAAQQVNSLLEDDLGDIVQEEQAREAASASAQAPAPGSPAPEAPAAAQPVASQPAVAAAPVQAPAQFAAPAAMPMAYPTTVAVPSTSPKALWVLTAGVLLFMVGILTIAWRATSVFQQQIQAVRNDVEAATNELQESTTGSIKELAMLERELLRNQVAAAKLGRDSEKVYEGLAIQAPHEVVLSVAAEAIEANQFPEARKMLFTLLAEADNHPEAVRSEMERRANFLIAQSHKEQAEAMTGGQQ